MSQATAYLQRVFQGVALAWMLAPALLMAQPSWSAPRQLRLTPADEPAEPPPVVTAVDVQPNGQLLATAGDDHLVRLWDPRTGRLVRRLVGHSDWVRSLVFSPDGEILATAGDDRSIVLWDPATGRKLRTLATLDYAISRIAFSRDGRHLAVAGFDQANLPLLEVADGSMVRQFACPCRDMRALAFSPTGRILAAGGRNGTIHVWSLERGELLRQYAAHRGRIRDLCFAPDGKRLVSCGEDRRVRVFRLDRQDEGYTLPARRAKVLSATFCGTRLLATGGSDNRIHLWDLEENREAEPLEGHTGSISALTWQADMLVSASYDTTVRIWRATSEVAVDPQKSASRPQNK